MRNTVAKTNSKLLTGILHGLPISLGYFWVAFAYGVISTQLGFSPLIPLSISLSNYTGTGQFVGTNLIALGSLYSQIIFAMFIINIRYSLMSILISQKLDPNFKIWQRLIIAFGVTDENFAVAIKQKEPLTFSYLVGLMLCAYIGWVSGTLLGALMGNIFPAVLLNSFGIALYAMFVAIIIPATSSSKPIALLVLISIIFSLTFYFTPFLKKLEEGWVLIIGSIVCTTAVALLFPHQKEEAESGN